MATCDPFIKLGNTSYPVYYDKVSLKCVTTCPSGQPYSWSVDRACYASCPADSSGNQYYKDSTTMKCVSVCPNVTQNNSVITPLFIDNITNSCVTSCDNSTGYWGYLDPSNGKMSCILNCPHGYFRDTSSGLPLCTKVCPYPSWFGDFNILPNACK